MIKEIVFIDFETFWSKTHSLSKMLPMDYVMHPDTQLISMAIKVGLSGGPIEVVFGEADIRAKLAEVDLTDKLVVGHNMSDFDSMILAWRLQQRPAMYGCTLSMARPKHAKTTGLGLGKLVKHYEKTLEQMGTRAVKDQTALINTQGKRLEDFTEAELAAMRVYNADDTDQCRSLFIILRPLFTTEEMFHIDCNIRMLVEPGFRVNRKVLEDALREERAAKRQALMDVAKLLRPATEALAVDMTDGPEYEDDAFWLQDEDAIAEYVREQLASAPKFAKLLESREVEVPMKPSPTVVAGVTKMIPALAKTDEAFQELTEHEDPVVAAAARARLSVKSTLLETRITAFLSVSETVGFLPVPLKYAGADTTGRDSGWAYNPQNMPRIPRDKDDNIIPRPSNSLRLSLEAPPGYVVGVADQSGIELRVNHFLWKVPSSMALYQASPDKADLYRDFAAFYYGKPGEEIVKHERQFGKVCQLGLGFGSGAKTFMRVARTMGGIKLTLAEAESGVQRWRQRYSQIHEGWQVCQNALRDVVQRNRRAVDPWGLVTTCPDGLRLPSGRLIRYPNLRQVEVPRDPANPDAGTRKAWVYADGRHKTFLTGPKVDENIVQALARDSVFECALRFFKLTGLRPRLRVHDELIYFFPENRAEELLAGLQAVMRTPPSWWPELVVWSEGDIAKCYGEAK